ncbi:hypothetical protein A9Q83_00255 [Alphaproteobacteria bacterium 46_93_T64]|nr:hypothetical protein A9Q83_00255 [Alphaproteobacteria bacterium 46_93_T64]
MFTKKRNQDDIDNTVTEYPTPAAKAAISAAASNVSANATSSPFPLKGTDIVSTTPIIASGSRLHVGKDIHLKGEITACDRLIVEGKVEASMNSNEIEITESGIFIGEVNIDRADISGVFDGKLTARTHLIIRKTGRVTGDIQYDEIEIEPGGEISGNFNKNTQKRSGKKSIADSEFEIPADTLAGGPTYLK